MSVIGRGKSYAALLGGITVLGLLAACGVSVREPSEHVVFDASRDSGARARTVVDEQEVIAFLEEDIGGEVTSVMSAEGGALVVAGADVFSVGLDPVKKRWAYGSEGALSDALVTPDGDKAVLFLEVGGEDREQPRVVVIDALSGKLEDSHRNRKEVSVLGVSNETYLMVSESGSVESRDLRDGDVLWTFDPARNCGGGAVDAVRGEAFADVVVVFAECSDENKVTASSVGAVSGDVLWERMWEREEIPVLFPFSEPTLAGGEGDPVEVIARGAFSGGYSLISATRGDDVAAGLWGSGEALDGNIPPPQNVGDSGVDNIVIVDGEHELIHRLVLQVAHVFYEEGRLSSEALTEEVLLVGEEEERLPLHPYEWGGGFNAKVAALRELILEVS